jgi:tRNA-2-methylthio-N6-dimethylallyladenosine synthase
MKSYFLETFGCQMNKSDSELMDISMTGKGYSRTDDFKTADVIIFNTCSVRKTAEDRALSRIREAKAFARKHKGIVVVTGCMAQRLGDKLRGHQGADIVIGPYLNPSIGSIVESFANGGTADTFVTLDRDSFLDRIHPDLSKQKDEFPWHKWVTISHGCENFCTYCIVPHVRGPLISFDSKKLLQYIATLPDNGIFEITLLGQNVNQYGQDNGDVPFYKLLEETAKIKGIEKINFLTSHPKDFETEIIRVIRDYPNISRSIHLPVQSGSDKILKAMNRKYTFGHYMKIVDFLNDTLKDYSITTDIIVGFPGETEEDFQATLDAVKLVRYDEAFMYAYSPREGTASVSFEDQIDKNEKSRRLKELIKVQRAIGHEKLTARKGKTEKVIFERISKKDANELMGRSFCAHPVIMQGNESDLGKILTIKIESVKGHALIGAKVD